MTKAVGRPPAEGKARNAKVEIRCLPAERDQWRRAAGNVGISEWARERLNRAAATTKAKRPKTSR